MEKVQQQTVLHQQLHGLVPGPATQQQQQQQGPPPLEPDQSQQQQQHAMGDRAGFADRGANTERCLVDLLRTQPLVSSDGRFAFFNMEGFNGRFRAQFNDQQWDAARGRVLLPSMQLIWGRDFASRRE